jgi:hypothetical protein
LNLHPTRIEFDCPDVFVAARHRAPVENIKFNHILYTIGIIIMTIKEQFFSLTVLGGDEEVGIMEQSVK